jgi:hypothetical protein
MPWGVIDHGSSLTDGFCYFFMLGIDSFTKFQSTLLCRGGAPLWARYGSCPTLIFDKKIAYIYVSIDIQSVWYKFYLFLNNKPKKKEEMDRGTKLGSCLGCPCDARSQVHHQIDWLWNTGSNIRPQPPGKPPSRVRRAPRKTTRPGSPVRPPACSSSTRVRDSLRRRSPPWRLSSKRIRPTPPPARMHIPVLQITRRRWLARLGFLRDFWQFVVVVLWSKDGQQGEENYT